jgi:hypothetical protein
MRSQVQRPNLGLRPIVLACVLAALAAGPLSAQEQKPPPGKPDILVIVGETCVPTPSSEARVDPLPQVASGPHIHASAVAGDRRPVAGELQGVPDPTEACELQFRRGDAEVVGDAIEVGWRTDQGGAAGMLMRAEVRQLTFSRPSSQYSVSAPPKTYAQAKKPNILVIFGDDIGQTNIRAYSFGVVGYKTPNIDRIAKEGMMFTDYYAENRCTAGRSTFITGQVVCVLVCPR